LVGMCKSPSDAAKGIIERKCILNAYRI
jgi:hypothetical protein